MAKHRKNTNKDSDRIAFVRKASVTVVAVTLGLFANGNPGHFSASRRARSSQSHKLDAGSRSMVAADTKWLVSPPEGMAGDLLVAAEIILNPRDCIMNEAYANCTASVSGAPAPCPHPTPTPTPTAAPTPTPTPVSPTPTPTPATSADCATTSDAASAKYKSTHTQDECNLIMKTGF